MTTTFDTIRRLDRREIDRLAAHLNALDAEGWLEQSYCAEWQIYQVVSHVASGARLFLGLFAEWFDGGPPMDQEQMRRVWAEFDALEPGQMAEAFQSAVQDYFARLDALPSEAGQQEVNSFIGTVSLEAIMGFRLHEVVLHTWDVLVARDRSARIPSDTVDLLLTVQLHIHSMRTPAALAGKRIHLQTPDGAWQRLLDFRNEKPVITTAPAGDAEIQIEAPGEELCRLLSGRHFLPGSLPRLRRQGGAYQDLLALNVFGG